MTTTLMLETAGAEIAYDVRGPLPTADGRPPLFMIGQPMDASGYRLGTRLHDRRRARRHRPLRLAAQALRLHRPLPARLPVGRVRSTRPARQTGTEVPAVGARRGRRPCQHPPAYRERYQRTKTRLGKQRGAKIAQVDLARRLAEAIWHMLTRDRPFAPAGATDPLAA
jgi:hypothetical protein